MFNLVLKDFLIQKKSLLFIIGYCGFVLVFFAHSKPFSQSVYIMAAGAVSYLLVQGAGNADGKNNSDLILNSLPVNRKQIVLAKYLSLGVYLATGLISTVLIGRILSFSIDFPVRSITYTDITVAVISVGIMGSLYLPLFFKFGNNITRFVNMVLFMLTFFVPGIIMEHLNNQPSGITGQLVDLLRNVPGWSVILGALAVTAVLVVVSLAVSLTIYTNKDL